MVEEEQEVCVFCALNPPGKIGLSACIQLLIMKHPSRKVQDLRHLLGHDPIEDKTKICLLDSGKNKLEYSVGSDSYTVGP